MAENGRVRFVSIHECDASHVSRRRPCMHQVSTRVFGAADCPHFYRRLCSRQLKTAYRKTAPARQRASKEVRPELAVWLPASGARLGRRGTAAAKPHSVYPAPAKTAACRAGRRAALLIGRSLDKDPISGDPCRGNNEADKRWGRIERTNTAAGRGKGRPQPPVR